MIKRSDAFHIADCDIYSILYVALGEELGLPTSPNQKLRDGKRALVLGEKLQQLWPTAS